MPAPALYSRLHDGSVEYFSTADSGFFLRIYFRSPRSIAVSNFTFSSGERHWAWAVLREKLPLRIGSTQEIIFSDIAPDGNGRVAALMHDEIAAEMRLILKDDGFSVKDIYLDCSCGAFDTRILLR